MGKRGLVVEDIDPQGKIEYASEIWDAMTEGKWLPKGEQVMIIGFQGLGLLVVEIPDESIME